MDDTQGVALEGRGGKDVKGDEVEMSSHCGWLSEDLEKEKNEGRKERKKERKKVDCILVFK